MFSANACVGGLSENDLIALIRRWLGDLNPETPEGIGDDCAVWTASGETRQIVTTDALVYGRHFDNHISAEQAGAKLVNRNLSDIAGMGGVPDRAVLNLMPGPDLEMDWLEAFFRGLCGAAKAAGLKIVGGDICRLDAGTFSSVLTVFGTAKKPLTRRTAQIGDALFVTGALGGSIEGKHATFTPRLKEGQWLAEKGHCSALMDLTDGLSKDLPKLLDETQAAELFLNAIPLSEDCQRVARQSGHPALEHAFCDGEDYELLFAIGSGIAPADFLRDWHAAFPALPVSHIGRVGEARASGPLINADDGAALPFVRGFEHFHQP